MFLKHITVSGFKSFCDRVDFDFAPGITCIVGPNGCGKSNVVDAVKWVLGEQSARSLRGRQMLDMIFSGSTTRRSSSLAQVDLAFDNSDRALPLDTAEVTVSRKLYRSGESEYLLNKTSTRLKDIRELFMDTGIGVDAYSIIEQGKVDVLLQSSPAERRAIFEEAAGISKYKARRREAERKLERTQQNLLRVGDIVEELEKRLRSVKLQAGKARSYKTYEARLNELRSTYALAEYHRFSQEKSRLVALAQQCSDDVTACRADINRHEAEGSRITLRLDELAEQISSVDGQLVTTRSNLAAHEERIEAANNRAEEQKALLARAEQRIAGDASRAGAARVELSEVERSAVELLSQTRELEAQTAGLAEHDQALARELTQAQAVLEDQKAGIVELLRKSAQTHNEIIRLNTHRESLVGQKGRLSMRDAQLASELEAMLEQKARLTMRVGDVETLISDETQRLEEKNQQAQRINSLKQQLSDQLAQTKEQRSAMRSRRELLADLERRMEGLGAGVRKLLDQKGLGDSLTEASCIQGLVADVFEADVDHAGIIEAALGQRDQYLVVSDSRSFLRYTEAVGGLPGRVVAMCMDRLPPLVNPKDFSSQPGFIARAVDLVRFREDFDQLANCLFGKTVVVEDLQAALEMASQDVTGHRFVTLQGEVVDPNGSVALGPSRAGAGLISRKSELRNIDSQMDSVDERVRTLADQLNRTTAEADHIDGVRHELRTAIYESNTAKVEANATLQSIAETIGRLTNEQPLIAHEVILLEHQISEVLEKSNVESESLDALERENQRREAEVEKQQERIDSIVSRRKETQESLTDARVGLGQLNEKRVATADTINTLNRGIAELEESVASGRHDVQQCQERIAESETAARTACEQVSTLSERIEEIEIASSKLRQTRESLRADMDGRAQLIKSARVRLEETEAKLHENEMALAEVKVRRDELVARVADELSVDLPTRYQEYEYQDHDWEQVEAEISELRAKMDRLGNVNLDAIKELEDLQQRHEFLTRQRDDLTESHTQLQQLITKLNTESRERFKKSFEQIREHFRGMFRKLFGGGRADIVLEDPDDLLDSGIEIVAQPPGKELQVISLMSGGEKSLTAIALLMSIFKSKPAPFAILDEVDAALDEANNDRFNRILQEFVSGSQFLVITHSKWTMNVADRLYGVTMHEPGVSTRVGVELTGANVA
ncbi:MAG: chromosome segregation protein SMC [Phycisphaerales bacterium]|nr:MAG: chromosome segregation protein SMC [Phycisphaerales bacterium]